MSRSFLDRPLPARVLALAASGVLLSACGGSGGSDDAPPFPAPPRLAAGTLTIAGQRVGCSAGGRHAMVGAARYADQYDGVFSPDDTAAWYDRLRGNYGGVANDFARLYFVPGMNHCSAGPATDQFDMVSARVAWVEQGQAPDRVIASARGAGNAGGVNAELPANRSANRTRPLCPSPQVARNRGTGDPETAASFSCQ